MGELRQDLRQALRAMRKSPMLGAVAVLSLALGIGATTAIFTVVHQVLLSSLPYHDPDRLFAIWEESPSRGFETMPVTPANLADWKARTRVFEDIGLSTSPPPYFLTGVGEPVSVLGYRFDANMFRVFGTKPMLGRTFTEDEDRPGFDQVVVLSHKLWARQFNSDPGVIGRSVTFSGKPYTVIGVMPPGFRHPQSVELWTPLAMSLADFSNRKNHKLRVIGRLREGVTREEALRELNAVAAQLEREHPDTNKDWHVRLKSLREEYAGDVRPVLLALLSAVVLMLLIACTNIANLLMARATERHREFAVRVALGASRARLIRQVLSESLLLSCMGGAFGLLLACLGTEWLVRMFPTHIANLDIPPIESLPIDTTVLFFCLGASIGTGLLFGTLPALQTSVTDVVNGLRETSTSYSASGRGKRSRNVLVVAEVAIAIILLTGAGLALKSYKLLSSSRFGFEPDHVLSFYISMPSYKYKDEDAQRVYMGKLLASIGTVPGVNNFGALSYLPLSGYSGSVQFGIEGRSFAAGEEPSSDVQIATPGYFGTMRIPLLEGRDFSERDTPKTPTVAVVSRKFARQFFAEQSPVGRRLNFGTQEKPDWVQIVGVAGDVQQNGLDNEVRPELYVAFAQNPSPIMGFVLRTTVDPDSVMSAARQAVWAVDKDQPLSRVVSMEDAAQESLAIRRITTTVMTLFAAVSLLLACIGIYGVIAFNVVQRTHEFGIRLALGATRIDVLAMVLKQFAQLGAIGLAIGIASAFALSKTASALVYGISTHDPMAFVLAPLVLGSVAMIAALIPAWRASRLDPYVALREE